MDPDVAKWLVEDNKATESEFLSVLVARVEKLRARRSRMVSLEEQGMRVSAAKKVLEVLVVKEEAVGDRVGWMRVQLEVYQEIAAIIKPVIERFVSEEVAKFEALKAPPAPAVPEPK